MKEREKKKKKRSEAPRQAASTSLARSVPKPCATKIK